MRFRKVRNNLGKRVLPLALAIVSAALVCGASALQNSSEHKVLFEKAKFTMETKGDLKGAIDLFEEIIRKYPNEREYAAKSQLYIGMCYEKLGFGQAQAAYQKVVERYPEQTEAVSLAREKLMTLTRLQTLSLEADARFHLRRVAESSSWWKGSSLSPHGRFIAFADRMNSFGDVALCELSSGKVRRLTSDATETEGAYECAVSPDGKRVAYGWLNNSDGSEELRVVGVDGSRPVTLYRDPDGIPTAPAGWSPDGTKVVVYHQGIALVSLADGSIRLLKKGGPHYLNGRIRISPDGRWIAYDWPPGKTGWTSRDIFVLSTDGRTDAPLIEKTSNDVLLDWCPDGKSLLFQSDRTGGWDAWRVRVEDGKTDGPAELVKKDLGSVEPLGFTRGGSFFFVSSLGGTDIYTAAVDVRTGTVTESPRNPIESQVGGNVSATWSPDGRRLAYLSTRPDHKGLRIVLRSVETGEEREIASQPGFYGMEWFPDGRSLKVYGEDEKGHRGLFRVDIESGAVEPLLMQTPEAPLNRVCLAPDGKTVFYSTHGDSDGSAAILAFDIGSRHTKEIWRGAGKIGRVVPSPDGQRLALEIQRAGVPESRLAVMSTDGGEIKDLTESSSGGEFVWTPDSRQILFARSVPGTGWGSSRQALWAVPASGGTPKSLNLESRMLWLLTMHPDGNRIAFTSDTSRAEIWVMENFLPENKAGRGSK